MKLIYVTIWSIVCLVVALLPEMGMYAVYTLINPVSELARIAMFIAFWFGGAGICMLFAFLSFAIWVRGLMVMAG